MSDDACGVTDPVLCRATHRSTATTTPACLLHDRRRHALCMRLVANASAFVAHYERSVVMVVITDTMINGRTCRTLRPARSVSLLSTSERCSHADVCTCLTDGLAASFRSLAVSKHKSRSLLGDLVHGRSRRLLRETIGNIDRCV